MSPHFAIDALQRDEQATTSASCVEGGYNDRSLWTDAGWEWITSQEHAGILHFGLRGDSWRYRTMFDRNSLPLDWPVYVSHDEASAYAAGLERNCRAKPNGTAPLAAHARRRTRNIPGARRRLLRGTAILISSLGPVPWDRIPEGVSDFGVADLVGNGWEWTRTPFRAFSRLPAIFVLSRILREFLRREAFRDEGRFAAHGGVHAAAVVSQLVPASLSLRVRDVSRRRTLTPAIRKLNRGEIMATAVIAQHSRPDLAGTCARGLLPARPEGASFEISVRRSWLRLFEVISVLPEYGLTRADERLLRRHAADIVSRLKPHVLVAELGSGSGKKTRWLLEALARRQRTTYCPIELSPTALARCESELGQIECVSIVGFERPYLDGLLAAAARRSEDDHLLVLFLGSTIGNFDRDAPSDFSPRCAAFCFPATRSCWARTWKSRCRNCSRLTTIPWESPPRSI
jgi:hypothetical protein